MAKKFKEVEREYFLELLKETGGNVAQAAKVSGLARATVYRKLAKHFGESFIQNWEIIGMTDKGQLIALPLRIRDHFKAEKTIDRPEAPAWCRCESTSHPCRCLPCGPQAPAGQFLKAAP